jgi:hypothetical protein
MLHCVELVCILLYVVFYPFLHCVVCGCLYDETKFYIYAFSSNRVRYTSLPSSLLLQYFVPYSAVQQVRDRNSTNQKSCFLGCVVWFTVIKLFICDASSGNDYHYLDSGGALKALPLKALLRPCGDPVWRCENCQWMEGVSTMLFLVLAISSYEHGQ